MKGNKEVITARTRKASGIMSIVRTNQDSSVLDQALRVFEEEGTGQRAVRVVIETPDSEWIVKLGIQDYEKIIGGKRQ